jgi:hypothetical protein
MNKRKSTGIRVSAITFMVILSAAVSAGARVFPAPSWSGNAGTTFQQWSFSDGSANPSPDVFPAPSNPYGSPQLSVYGSQWSDNLDGHQGVWTFSSFGSGVLVNIPNNPVSQPVKEMQVELIWEAASISAFIPDQPIIGVWADNFQKQLTGEESIGGNWKASLYKISIWPNPSAEQITINGDIRLDQIIVDTICIPEPATMALFVASALYAAKRGKKRQAG